MKIFSSPHIISRTTTPMTTDIPVGHTEEMYAPTGITIEKEEDFVLPKNRSLMPYDEIENIDSIFFNKDNKVIRNINTNYVNNTHTYMPTNITEFVPSTFSFQALLQRKGYYSSAQQYNLSIGVDDIDNWDGLISIFGNAAARGICPPNIVVNNGSCKEESLQTAAVGETDFYFIETTDGITYKYFSNIMEAYSTSDTEEDIIDFDYLLTNHTNVWLAVDNQSINLFEQFYGQYSVSSSSPAIYRGDITVPSSYGYQMLNKIDLPFDIDNNDLKLKKINLFTPEPLAVYQKENGAYLIISHKNLFNDPIETADLIYETLMYVYFHSYKLSKKITSWITNDKIDYIGRVGRQFNANHRTITMDDVCDGLRNDDNPQKIKTYYDMVAIDILKGDVFYNHLDNEQCLHFYKLGTQNIDPVKQPLQVSLLTVNDSVMYYTLDSIFEIESGLDIFASIHDSICNITVKPFRSSSHNINIPEEITITIPDISKTYYLTASRIDDNDVSQLYLETPEEYVEHSYTKLATIKTKIDTTKFCNDVRMTGGGLPLKMDNDYDMLDIGNLYGKPYRVGSTLIIRLPDNYEKYDEYIQAAVQKYKNASTYTIIYYNKN